MNHLRQVLRPLRPLQPVLPRVAKKLDSPEEDYDFGDFVLWAPGYCT